jgi:uncharacterized protein YoxC
MNKIELLDALKKLSQSEDILAVSREVAELRHQFDDVLLKEDHQYQVAKLEAEERGETVEERPEDEVREAFFAEYFAFQEKRKALQAEKKAAEEANLRNKKGLIERLRQVISDEENIGVALNAYKEIHEAWKQVGDIPREKRQEIQSDYSKLLELFFSNIKIYRTIREHDLHRNKQLKEEVIEKIKKLADSSHIKEIEQAIKTLQNEWEEIGPVANEAWEELKNQYWEAVRTVYTKIQAFYEERRTELTANLEQKKALVTEAMKVLKETDYSSIKDWEQATEAILKLQEGWKQIGFGPRKENEDVWKEFRAVCDEFFSSKKSFFDGLKSKFDEVANKKQSLIEKLEALKESTDWKKTTDQILAIQKEWKTLGNAGQRFEQKLWKDFRAACDHFFTSKQAHFSSMEEGFAENLIKKQAIIEKLNSTPLPEDKKEALAWLKEVSAEFSAIGHVPMKEKDAIYKAYRDAIDAHYKKLKLEGEEQEKMMFQAKIENLKSSANPDKALNREHHDLMDKINQIKSDILQYENNLGFFAKSKGADTLRKEVENKIAAAHRKMDELKLKIKMLRES